MSDGVARTDDDDPVDDADLDAAGAESVLGEVDEDVDAEGIEPLLRHIRDTRAFDFSGYKRASLVRRIQKRMQEVRAPDYAHYTAVLEAEPDEFAALFDTILINVTSFRRDREAWDFLAESVLPALGGDARDANAPIRCWSVGCASGQEPYTLAVLLCERYGEDRFRRSIKIYATDADDDALDTARSGTYSWDAILAAFGEELGARYFDRAEDRGTFRQDLRRSLIFGRHDVLQDPPISRIDLLLCRNTLMYFTADVQRQVLSTFHFALKPKGYLFLGKAEALVTRTNLFRASDLKSHVFVKNESSPAARPSLGSTSARREPPMARTILDTAFELAPAAQLVVDAAENLVVANRQARLLFGIGTTQVGRPLRDLDVSYRPVELRSVLARALSDGQPVTLESVENRAGVGSDLAYLDVQVVPFREAAATGCIITFTPVGQYRMLQDELERSQREVQSAYEELQSVVEELETTNEELQSTNEELETTNEELHSTNEELETMNEELQSTNEELGAVNSELRRRGTDLDDANGFLEAVLRSLDAGVVVVAVDLTVRAWNDQAEDLWGLRASEVVGQHFLNLDIGLPVEQLRQPIRDCLASVTRIHDVVIDAVNRRGRTIECRISVSPLLNRSRTPDGTLLVMRAVER